LIKTIRSRGEYGNARRPARALSGSRDAEALHVALENSLARLNALKEKHRIQRGEKSLTECGNSYSPKQFRSLTTARTEDVSELLSNMRTRIPDWLFCEQGVIQRGSMLLSAGLERTYRRGRQHYRIVETIGMENALTSSGTRSVNRLKRSVTS